MITMMMIATTIPTGIPMAGPRTEELETGKEDNNIRLVELALEVY